MDNKCCRGFFFVAAFVCHIFLFQFTHGISRRFKATAKANSVAHAPIHLQHGDFLKSAGVKKEISRAGLVFMNNVLFTAELNHEVLSECVSAFVTAYVR